MEINSSTRLTCLIGNPINKSFSPFIHNYLFDKYKVNSKYVCFNIESSKLSQTIPNMTLLNMLGGNITVPHKVEVAKYLDLIDKRANLIGAVNTIKNEDGVLKGYNTDGYGFVKSIEDKGYNLKNKKVLILGSGGACRSIAVELAENEVSEINIRNRSTNNSKEIAKVINENYKTKVFYSTNKVKSNDLEDIDILINTTPIGMESEDCPIDESIKTSKNILVCDIVYKPHETQFIKWAKKNGLNVVYGIDMLINQGLEAFYILTGIKPTKEDEIAIKEFYELKNK